MPTFLSNWKFLRQDLGGAGDPGLNDSDWREVCLPHDWSIEDVPGTDSPFSSSLSTFKGDGGHTVGGTGWYRNTLTLDPERRHRITFHGVFGETQVWVDGELAAENFYGYTPFSIVIPAGRESTVIALKVVNTGEVGRWYTGSGLYRPVEIEALGQTAILRDGLVARIGRITPERALLEAFAETEADCLVEFRVLGPGGEEIDRQEERAGPEGLAAAEFFLRSPQLWNSWDSPLSAPGRQPLYTLEARVVGDNSGLVTRTTFGIRTVEFDAANGLRVNGQKVLLKGGCIHHDNGILGACAYASAELRKILLLKEAGFNAIRTAHNPPSAALLDACDQEGILVIDEVHDEWERPKRADSYHKHFNRLGEADAQAMVRRDRNHASVWCWSVGNEIPGSYETPEIALRLKKAVLACDPTRPISAGLCPPWWQSEVWVDWETSSDPAFEHLEIGGMNYIWQKVRPDHERHPNRLMMQTETYPLAAWDSWKSVEECPWNFGDFVWTAQDYIGESGIGQSFAGPDDPLKGAYPYHLAVCGDLDLIGDRKPQSHHRESLWREGVLSLSVHVPESIAKRRITEGWMYKWGWDEVEEHWNWPGFTGQPLKVELTTSCVRLEISLNGRVIAERKVTPDDKGRVFVEVPYEPGTLVAKGWDSEEKIIVKSLRTVGAVETIAAESELTGSNDPDRLIWLKLSLIDARGQLVRVDDREVSLSIDGPGELIGFGNASPVDVDSLQDSKHRTYKGRALAVIKQTGEEPITISLTSEGLVPNRFILGSPLPGAEDLDFD
jgi:beta-galactosidase